MTTVGAIRWDAYYTDTGPAASTAASLGAAEYVDRAPFFTERVGRRLRFRPTEATMSREIEVAAAAGMYWAFLHYDPNGNDRDMNAGFDLFQANPNKNDVQWCSIVAATWFANGVAHPGSAWAPRVDQLVAWMGQQNYLTVAGGRPLVYIFYQTSNIAAWFGGSDANFKVVLDALRAACIAADLQNPYIVIMRGGGTDAESTRVALGGDAISSYVSRVPVGLRKTYAALAAGAETYWAELAAASNSIVPIVMAGWERRPRIARPVAWEAAAQRPYFGMDDGHDQPTNQELAAHFQAALDYVTNNPSKCPADTIIAYAWNEHDEGGWLCPTLGDPGGDKLAAVAAVINGQ